MRALVVVSSGPTVQRGIHKERRGLSVSQLLAAAEVRRISTFRAGSAQVIATECPSLNKRPRAAI